MGGEGAVAGRGVVQKRTDGNAVHLVRVLSQTSDISEAYVCVHTHTASQREIHSLLCDVINEF